MVFLISSEVCGVGGGAHVLGEVSQLCPALVNKSGVQSMFAHTGQGRLEACVPPD